jgi:predicted alpha/beta superfamily hydrolase
MKTRIGLLGVFVAIAVATISNAALAQSDGEPITIGEYRVVQSKVLGEKRRVWVHLPESYHRSEQKYPVLYKCDALDISLFAARVGDLYLPFLRGYIPQIMIVSIENTDRWRDMFPAKGSRDDITPGADKFLQFISEELVPFIENSYRTDGFKMLMGESNSAMFAVYAFLEKPGLFNGTIASSPELGWCPEFFANLAHESLKNQDISRGALFLIHGAKDNERVLESVPRFVEILERDAPKALEWKLTVVEDGGHVPPSSMVDGLTYIFDGYKLPEGLAEEGLDAIKKYYAEYSRRKEHDFRIPGRALNDLAMSLVRQDKPDEALGIYRTVMSDYREKDLLVAAMLGAGRIYASKGMMEEAIDCYERLMKIWPPGAGICRRRIAALREQS